MRSPRCLVPSPPAIWLWALLLLLVPSWLQGQIDIGRLKGLMDAQEFSQVVQAVQEARGSGEVKAEALFLASEAALRLNNPADAEAFASMGLKHNPDDSRGLLLLGHAMWSHAQRQPQTGAFRNLTLLDSGISYRQARMAGGDTFECAYFAAGSFEEGGDLDKALEEIELAIEAKPEHIASRFTKARLLESLGRRDDARAVLEQLITMDGAEGQAAEALLAFHLRHSERAVVRSMFLDLTLRFPEQAALYAAFVEKFQQDNPPDFLQSVLEEARERPTFESNRFLIWYLGSVALQKMQAQQAFDYYERYRGLTQGTADGHMAVGHCLVALGRLAEARTSLDRARELGAHSPDNLVLGYERLLLAHQNRKEFQQAVEAQQAVVELAGRPRDDLNLSSLLYNAGHREGAVAVCEALLQRDDADDALRAQTLNYQALYLVGLGRPVEAAKLFDESLAVDPGSGADARENLGVLLLSLGKSEEARKSLESVLLVESNRVRSRYHLLRIKHSNLFPKRDRN